jgi:hypothetical protein
MMTLQQVIDMLVAQPETAKGLPAYFRDNGGAVHPVGPVVEVNGGDTNYNPQGAILSQPVAPGVYMTQQ